MKPATVLALAAGVAIPELLKTKLLASVRPAASASRVPVVSARVPLPKAVGKDESVAVEIAFTLQLPPFQGRWGQYNGVTFLSNWLPVLAVYDDSGWQPTPFIPWHQPFFNEAGIFNVRVTLPADQKLASTASVLAVKDRGDGWQ